LNFRSNILEVLQTLAIALLIYFILHTFVIQPYKVDGQSMEPNLHPSEYLLVDKISYQFNSPQRGDIIVFLPPGINPPRPYIKRVVGMPGEKFEIKGGQVLINGKTLEEPYLKSSHGTDYPEITIPPNGYFVLGDNRNNSSDSRTFGFVAKQNIIGRAWFSYWPPSEWEMFNQKPALAQ